MQGTFSIEGLDENDVNGAERRWNQWVDELAEQGLKPAEEPDSFTQTAMTFSLLPLAVLVLARVS